MKKIKNRQSLIGNSLNKHPCLSKDKRKTQQRCKSQNAYRIEQPKKPQCKTHRNQNSLTYHTIDKHDYYQKIIDEMGLKDNKMNFNQFVMVINKMKKYLGKRVNLSEDNLMRAWKVVSKTEQKVSQKQLAFHMSNIESLFTASEQLHKPRIKMIKPKVNKIKKQHSNITLPKKQKNKKSSCKSFISQKQNIEPNRFYSLKPLAKQVQVIPELQVIVKIQQGVIQRLVIYPDTCLSTLARQFGLKYKLPNCKVVMLRDMIQSQLKKHLTQITQQSHYTSDRSCLFNTLNQI